MEKDILAQVGAVGRPITLPFYGTCAAGGEKTLVSKQITFPYVTLRFRVSFALNTNRLLKVKFFISSDDEAPSSGEPQGVSVFAPYGQVDYFVGDDEKDDMQHVVLVNTAGTFIKMYAKNEDSWEHTMDAVVFIEALPREEEK